MLALGLVLSACSAGGTATKAPTSAPVTTAPASGAVVKLATSALGQIVVDANGRTVYGFMPDEAGGTPTCYDSCAQSWPALTSADTFTVGEGLDQSAFTTVPRTDAAGNQIKFSAHPLYYFSGDSGSGQTNGQGVGGKWYVVGADGALIKQ